MIDRNVTVQQIVEFTEEIARLKASNGHQSVITWYETLLRWARRELIDIDRFNTRERS